MLRARIPLLPVLIVGLICLFLGVGTGAAVLAFVPDPGSSPAIFDDFNYSSTGSGFWHVNAIGAEALFGNDSTVELKGASIELDHRIQTDNYTTVVSMKVRARQFHKFGLGLGIYHSGTIGMEFDDDGIKCGRATDVGYFVDFVKGWSTPPVNQWFYLQMTVNNPYPDPAVLAKLGNVDFDKLKKVTMTCRAWDAHGHLLGTVTPTDPPANTHYQALDEAYLRTWDHGNDYQVDWIYAGPRSGDPLEESKVPHAILQGATAPGRPAKKRK